jgi:hypothetical protein
MVTTDSNAGRRCRPANSLHQQRMRSPGRLPDECGCCPFLVICRHMTIATFGRQHHFDSKPFLSPSADRSIDHSLPLPVHYDEPQSLSWGRRKSLGRKKQIPNRFLRWIVVLGHSCSWVVLMNARRRHESTDGRHWHNMTTRGQNTKLVLPIVIYLQRRRFVCGALTSII